MTRLHRKLIGASLGPGDPGLITRPHLGGVAFQRAGFTRLKHAGKETYALSLAERGGLAIPADTAELVFPMTRDARSMPHGRKLPREPPAFWPRTGTRFFS